MIIIEMQQDDIIREYEFPDELRQTATDFFNYLVKQEEIVSWAEMPVT